MTLVFTKRINRTGMYVDAECYLLYSAYLNLGEVLSRRRRATNRTSTIRKQTANRLTHDFRCYVGVCTKVGTVCDAVSFEST